MSVNRLFSSVIGSVAVAVFFLVPGYLFIRNCEFSKTAYITKLKCSVIHVADTFLTMILNN